MLFRQPVTLRFTPEICACPDCGKRLLAYKTSSRNLVKLNLGSFRAHSTEYYCPFCKDQPVFRPSDLASLAAPGNRFCYDIMVYCGKAALQRYRTVQEIVDELYQHNVDISPSEVRLQAERFVLYLGETHRQSQDAIKSLLQKQGGYILHLDGTCDGASSHLMSAMDGVSGLVLLGVKIPSESTEALTPILRDIKDKFGEPLAVVSDMAKSIHKAVIKVFDKTPHYLCHFHFLRDIGKDLLEPNYGKIRNCLKSHGITTLLRRRSRELMAEMGTAMDKVDEVIKNIGQGVLPQAWDGKLTKPMAYAMIAWVLAGKNQGNGYGFPFDLPLVEFYRRMEALAQALKIFADASSQPQTPRTSLAVKLAKDLDEVLLDKTLRTQIKTIRQKMEVFSQFRQAMRLAPVDKNIGLNDDGENVDMKAIEKSVTIFTTMLRQRKDFTAKGDYGKMVAQIEKYQEQLFIEPIQARTSQGVKFIYPNRTNNILERFFRGFKRGYCRQTGNRAMRRRIDTMLADTTLVKNLENQKYMEILLDGCTSLEQRFAKIDHHKIRRELKKARQEEGRTLPGLRKILSIVDWPQKVADIWLKHKSA